MPDKNHLAKIHILLKETGTKANKADIVSSFTNGRTHSSAQMTNQEAAEMIVYLDTMKSISQNGRTVGQAYYSADLMKRKIIRYAHEMGWKLPSGKIDMGHLNDWCVKYSSLKKKLDDHTYNELPALVTQFEKAYKAFLLKK